MLALFRDHAFHYIIVDNGQLVLPVDADVVRLDISVDIPMLVQLAELLQQFVCNGNDHLCRYDLSVEILEQVLSGVQCSVGFPQPVAEHLVPYFDDQTDWNFKLWIENSFNLTVIVKIVNSPPGCLSKFLGGVKFES